MESRCRCGARMEMAGWDSPVGHVVAICSQFDGRGHEYVIDGERRVMFGL